MGERMLKKLNAYRVTLRTNNRDTFTIRNAKGSLEKYPAENSCIIVITDNPEKIYRVFGNTLVTSIEKIEPGYKI